MVKIVMIGGQRLPQYERASARINADYVAWDDPDIKERFKRYDTEFSGSDAIHAEYLPDRISGVGEKFENVGIYPVTTGREALEKYKQMRPPLVLVAFRLPDMTGIDVAGAIQEMERNPR